MVVGESIKFGNYDWRVLQVQEDRALILTETMVEQRDYHSKAMEITWKDCELRYYLNHDFYQGFDEKERARIVPVRNHNPGNPWYKADGGEETEDYIFLLSMDEVVRSYFGDSSRLLDEPGQNQRYWFQRKDGNNTKRIARYEDSIWWWWLRTPGKNKRVAVYIHGDGNIGIQGNGVSKRNTNVIHHKTKDTRGGVRPALWIKTDKEITNE